MSDSVDRVFVHALNTVKRIPRTGSARPPHSDRLKLYGLYKQSTEGNVEGLSRRPEGNDTEAINETDKWDAWHTHHGLSKTEAKRCYISTLIETMHKYATTTPEARELVSELEFVWDQIKANSASSSNSAPRGTPWTESQNAISRRDEPRDPGLQVLRPVSSRDEEEDDDEEEEEFDEVRAISYKAGEEEVLAVGPGRQRGDFNVRNRKWRKRIERALVKMTTELAALREQMEAKQMRGTQRRNGLWAWIVWFVWVAVRHTVVDLALIGVLVAWARRKRDRRIEMGVRLLIQSITEQVKRITRPFTFFKQKR